jgi:cyanophycin synthetase
VGIAESTYWRTIISTLVLHQSFWLDGPNLWADRPCVLALFEFKGKSSDLASFDHSALKLLDKLGEHVVELHSKVGQCVKFHTVEEHGTKGLYRLIFRSPDRRVGKICLDTALDALHAKLENSPFDEEERLKAIRSSVDYNAFGPSTNHIVEAAYRRDIPVIRLNDGNLVQLGYGSLQERIWTAETSRTSAIAEYVACEKPLSKVLLSYCGVPIPEGEIALSPEDAWDKAQNIGLPVVIKPSDGNHSRGVSLDLKAEAEIHKAWHLANAEGSEVIVEKFIPGSEHRVLVVAGKVQAVARGELIEVVGDGKSDIQKLIDEQINIDPRRGEAEEYPLEPIVFSTNPLALLEVQRQGFEPDSVPKLGQKVLIQRNGNASEDVTDLIHPSIAQMCELAAKVVGLDVAGIDLVCEDISAPVHSQAAGVVEVNAGPGLLMHLKPSKGTPRDIGTPIVESLFPTQEGHDLAGKIPVLCYSPDGLTHYGERMAKVLRSKGLRTVLHDQEGMWLEDEFSKATVSTTRDELARRSLTSKHIDAAIFEFESSSMLTTGLPFHRPGTLVIASPQCSGAKLEEFGLSSEASRIRIWEAAVDLLNEDCILILNADQPSLAHLSTRSQAKVIWISENLHAEHTQDLIKSGARVAAMDDLEIHLFHGRPQALHQICREGPFGAITSSLEDLCLLATTWGMNLDLAFFYMSMSLSKKNSRKAALHA